MKLNIFKNILIAGSLMFMCSCSDMLNEKTYTFIAGEDLIKSGSYDQLVTGAYATLHYYFEWGQYHPIVNFDCDYQTGPTWAFTDIGAGNFYENGCNNTVYEDSYKAIERANYHSYLISQMKIDEKVKNNALGELAFLNAWNYFNLVQLYGDVCLYKKSVSNDADLYIPRSPIKDVYAYIIEQLKFAETAMYSVKDPAYKIGHVSSGAAKALLAKVYATIGSASMKSGKISVMGGPATKLDDNGNAIRIAIPTKLTFDKNPVAGYESFDSKEYYKLAMDKAKEVIQSGDFYLYPSQEALWSVANRNKGEFIFSLQTLAGNTDMSNFAASDYTGYYKNGGIVSGYNVQRDHWYQLFDDNDSRIKWGTIHRIPYYDEDNKTITTFYYPARDSVKVRLGQDGYQTTDQLNYWVGVYGAKLKKFLDYTTPVDGSRNDFQWPFLRYAEVILLYAEAANEVNGGPIPDAIIQVELLNSRNNSVKVSDIGKTTPWSQESFRSYILEERAKELAEEGVRRFDLIRWGIYLQTMNAIAVDENGVIKRRETRHLLLPLPANEVNTNPFIKTNNPGW